MLFRSKNIFPLFFSNLIICLITFLILNLRNKSYLGDSGSLSLSFLVSYVFIKSYQLKNNFLYADEIFLVMCIPGYELLRLTITRIIKRKSPFEADNNHIHHLLIKKIKFKYTFIIIQFLLIFPYIFFLLNKNFLISLIISLFLYCFIILFCKGRAGTLDK